MHRLKFFLWLLVAALAFDARAEPGIDALVAQAGIVESGDKISDRPRWSGARKILIRDIGIDLGDALQQYHDIEFTFVRSVSEAMRHARDSDAIIGYCDSELLAAARKLVWVQLYSAGAERCVVVDSVMRGDVVVTNMQKMAAPVIAEHAIAMMLALARKLPRFSRIMESGTWARDRESVSGMMPIAGKKLLVVGLGGIGTEIARLGAALGMHVSATRNSSREGPKFVEYVGLSSELHELAAHADVVISALPITAATINLFDKAFFSVIKPGTLFVNVGRGKSVVTDDLVAALDAGNLAGAGLDVTEPEPLPADHVLWRYENVIITPHVSSVGGTRERHRVLFLENLRRYVAGERLLNVVDPIRGY